MSRPKKSLHRVGREAAVHLWLCVAFVLGGCALLLYSMVWNQAGPVEADAFYSRLPGVDLDGLAASKKEALLKTLNSRRCPCDCMRTLASCRVHHSSCSMSLAAAREALAAAKSR